MFFVFLRNVFGSGLFYPHTATFSTVKIICKYEENDKRYIKLRFMLLLIKNELMFM